MRSLLRRVLSRKRLLRSGMRLFVRLAERGGADVGVDLRGDQALVAQQFLHAADVRAAVEQVRGEAVAELVRGGAAVQAGELEVFFEHSGDASRGDPPAELVDEYGGFGTGGFAGVWFSDA